MLDYLNEIFDVLQGYVTFIFSLYIVPGVSIGSIFMVSSLLIIIVKLFWARG